MPSNSRKEKFYQEHQDLSLLFEEFEELPEKVKELHAIAWMSISDLTMKEVGSLAKFCGQWFFICGLTVGLAILFGKGVGWGVDKIAHELSFPWLDNAIGIVLGLSVGSFIITYLDSMFLNIGSILIQFAFHAQRFSKTQRFIFVALLAGGGWLWGLSLWDGILLSFIFIFLPCVIVYEKYLTILGQKAKESMENQDISKIATTSPL